MAGMEIMTDQAFKEAKPRASPPSELKLKSQNAPRKNTKKSSSNMETAKNERTQDYETLNHDRMTFGGDHIILHEPHLPDDEVQLSEINEGNEKMIKTYHHSDEIDVRFGKQERHHKSLGSERIPPHPLFKCERVVVILIGILQIFAGSVAVIIGVVIQGALSLNSLTHAAPLWWTGLMPFTIGACGVLCGWQGRRKWVLVWGIASVCALLIISSVMYLVGNLYLSHYEVWPLHIEEHKGHPLCMQFMTHRCYCQDIGPLRGIYPVGIQANHTVKEDVLWVETGYRMCGEVYLVSTLYFTVIGCIVFYAFTVILTLPTALGLSVCAKSTLEQFYPLEEAGYDEPFDEEHNEEATSQINGTLEISSSTPV